MKQLEAAVKRTHREHEKTQRAAHEQHARPPGSPERVDVEEQNPAEEHAVAGGQDDMNGLEDEAGQLEDAAGGQ